MYNGRWLVLTRATFRSRY